MEVTEKLMAKVVKEDVKEEKGSVELYISVHGGLDQTFMIKISHNIINLKDSSCNICGFILRRPSNI